MFKLPCKSHFTKQECIFCFNSATIIFLAFIDQFLLLHLACGIKYTRFGQYTRPTVVREVMGSFPVGDSDFFFAPPPPSCDMLNIASYVISSPSLKFTIFLYLSPIGHFDIADPSSMQDACHYELSKYDLCSPRVSQQLKGLERPTGVRKVMGNFHTAVLTLLKKLMGISKFRFNFQERYFRDYSMVER